MLTPAKPAYAANAADWNAGRIIDDVVFTNKNSMSVSAIQSFLDDAGSYCTSNCLKDYTQDGETSAHIIWQAGQDYTINPQTLIVLLQKEQGLVTDTSPSATQYKIATGYGCPDTAPCNSAYYGFRNQVRKAAKLFRFIMDNPLDSNYPPGTNSILYHPNHACGTKSVNIMTRATSALYHYTPYTPNKAALDNLYSTGNGCSSYGNRNFWRVFTDWFGTTINKFRLISCSSTNYLVESGIRRKRQLTDRAVSIWQLDNAYFIPGDPGCSYDSYSMSLDDKLQSRPSGNKYFTNNGQAFKIQNQSIADAWGLGDVASMNLPQMNPDTIHALTVRDRLPRLAQSANTQKVYLINNGDRYYISDSETGLESPWLRLVRSSYGKVPMATFSGGVLSPMDAGSTPITYAFHDTGGWVLFDGGVIHRINTPDYLSRWEHVPTIDGPMLSDDVAHVIKDAGELRKGFRYHDYYYIVGTSGALNGTKSSIQAKEWGVNNAPFISTLLFNALSSPPPSP